MMTNEMICNIKEVMALVALDTECIEEVKASVDVDWNDEEMLELFKPMRVVRMAIEENEARAAE